MDGNLEGRHMKKDKFLTIYAVFDKETQQKLKIMQDEVLKLGNKGTQTMDIPFHISLGSFSLDKRDMLIEKIKEVCSKFHKFDINLSQINDFNNKVLFVEPFADNNLTNLHLHFDDNYADGFPWHAHATIFCGGEAETKRVKEKLGEIFSPFTAKIVALELGEFFPTKIIFTKELGNKTIKSN